MNFMFYTKWPLIYCNYSANYLLPNQVTQCLITRNYCRKVAKLVVVIFSLFSILSNVCLLCRGIIYQPRAICPEYQVIGKLSPVGALHNLFPNPNDIFHLMILLRAYRAAHRFLPFPRANALGWYVLAFQAIFEVNYKSEYN